MKPLKVNREVKDFWSKVDIKEPNDCWDWEGSKDRHGYGRLSYKGKREQLANRVVWELLNGEIPPSMCVCHSCDNTSCVNPAHLWLGTHQDNMADMMKKKRNRSGIHYGTDNPKSKLTEYKVREIRRRKKEGERTTDLAREFNVTLTAIRSIEIRLNWKWLK